MSFVDPQHGWVLLGIESSTAFSRGGLFRTTDGGATWARVALPARGPIEFLSPTDGWLVGDPLHARLFMTHDAGASWQEQSLATPTGFSSSRLSYNLPAFGTPSDGILVATLANPAHAGIGLYATTDGGITWNVTSTLPLANGLSLGQNVPEIDAIDLRHIEVSDMSSGTIRTTVDGGSHWTSSNAAGFPTGPYVGFDASGAGWALNGFSTCSAAKTDCRYQIELLATSDFGVSWRALEP